MLNESQKDACTCPANSRTIRVDCVGECWGRTRIARSTAHQSGHSLMSEKLHGDNPSSLHIIGIDSLIAD